MHDAPTPSVSPTMQSARRLAMGVLFEAEDKHFSPALMRSTVVIFTCLILLAILEVWVWLTLSTPFARVSVTGSMIVTAISFFIAGNTFRLRDIRRRVGNQARAGLIAPIDALSSLPPRDTIARRFLLGAIGAVVGVGTLLLTMVFSKAESQGGKEAMVASVLGIVCALLCFVGGTFARPID
jgi:cell division septal protein FtsQ